MVGLEDHMHVHHLTEGIVYHRPKQEDIAKKEALISAIDGKSYSHQFKIDYLLDKHLQELTENHTIILLQPISLSILNERSL